MNGLTLADYQHAAARTINRNLSTFEILSHGLYGLAAETGEVASIFQIKYQGHQVKIEALMKELGDCLWMIAEICTAEDIPLEDVAQMNIDKLKARYPDGFEAERSLHRREGDI